MAKLTEEEMIRQMQEADPDPQYPTEAGQKFNQQQGGGLPLHSPAEFLRGVPAPTTPPVVPQMTEEEMIRQMQEADPDPAGAPRDYTWGEVPGAAWSNADDSAAKFLGGIWHMVTHPEETGEVMTNLAEGAGVNAADMINPGSKDAWLKAHPADKDETEMASALGKFFVDRYGSWEAFRKTMAEDPIGFLADASSLLTGGAGAVRGAGSVGAKVAGVADKFADAGNPMNLLGTPAAEVGGRVVRATSNALNPEARLLNQATEGQVNRLAAELHQPTTLVPGSPPTAAQAVAQLPDTPANFQRLSTDAEKFARTAFDTRKDEQNVARLERIREVGRNNLPSPDHIDRAGLTGTNFNPATATVDELDAALRAANANNYAPVDPAMLTFDDTLLDVMQTPVMQDILKQAEISAANARRPLMVGQNVPAVPSQQVPSGVLGPNGQPVMTTIPGQPAQYAQISGKNLDFMKKAFNDALSKEVREVGADSQKARDIMAAQREFMDWVDQRIPEYRTAREDHATWSNLIARRRGAELFEDALTGRLHGEDQINQMAAKYAGMFDLDALKDNPKVKQITELKSIKKWDDLFTPEDMQYLTDVLEDLDRAKIAETKGKAPNVFAGKLGEASPGAQAPGMLNMGTTIVNYLARMLTGKVNEKTANKVANAMVDPYEMGNLLDKTIEHNAANERFMRHARRVGKGHKLPAVYNALNAEREEREKRQPR